MLRAYFYFTALSLHGVFDGLSVGSEGAGSRNWSGVLLAVLSHKAFDGLSLGCGVFPAQLPNRHRWGLLLVGALSTPVGIVAGMAASDTAADSAHARLISGIVLGLASGSFAFISLLELLPSSMADGRQTGLRLALFVAGFAAMAVLAYFV